MVNGFGHLGPSTSKQNKTKTFSFHHHLPSTLRSNRVQLWIPRQYHTFWKAKQGLGLVILYWPLIDLDDVFVHLKAVLGFKCWKELLHTDFLLIKEDLRR